MPQGEKNTVSQKHPSVEAKKKEGKGEEITGEQIPRALFFSVGKGETRWDMSGPHCQQRTTTVHGPDTSIASARPAASLGEAFQ